MILDTSALVAVVTGEEAAETIVRLLRAKGGLAVGAPSLVETAMVLAGRSGGGTAQAEADLARLLLRFDVMVVPFTDVHWRVAFDAFARFGKGRHPAALNLGDCLTYAVAKLSGRPLLSVGGDFAQTDLQLVPLTC